MDLSGWRKFDKTLLAALAKDAGLSAADLRVLLHAKLTERDPGQPFAFGAGFIAAGTGLDVRTVKRCRDNLYRRGYLIPAGVGVRGVALFQLATGGQMTTGQIATGGQSATPTGGQMTTSTGGQMTTSTGGQMTTQGRTEDQEELISTATPRRPANRGTALFSEKLTSEMKGQSLPAKPEKNISRARQKPAVATADVERFLAFYAEHVKPKNLDQSGSRKDFVATATKLLTRYAETDLLSAIRNYAGVVGNCEPQKRRGFQSFFGPKSEFYLDFLPSVFQDEASRASEAYYLAHKNQIDAWEDEIAQEAALAASGHGQGTSTLPEASECASEPGIDDFDPFGDYDLAAIDAVLEADR